MSRRAVPALVMLVNVVAASGCLSKGAAQAPSSVVPVATTSPTGSAGTMAAGGSEIMTSTTARPPLIPVPPKKCVAVTWRPDGGFRCELPDAVLGCEVGRSNLGPDAGEALKPICDLLTAPRSPWRVELVGHTSPEGDTPEGHQRLSNARADAVKRYLLSCNVAESRARAFGVGASQPSREGPHPEADRRVTVEILPL